jgi:O-antigen/teichoic acid export membrane protein
MQFTKALQHTIVWKSLNTLILFVINLLLVRIMGADYSGEFFYAITALSLFVLVLSGSIESGITYYGSHAESNIPALSFFLLPWLLLQALVAYWVVQVLPVTIHSLLSWLFVISNVGIIYFSALFYARKWFISLNLIIAVVNTLIALTLWYIYARYGNEQEKVFGYAKQHANRSIIITNLLGETKDTKGIYFASLAFVAGLMIQALSLIVFFYAWSGFRAFSFTVCAPLIKKVLRYSALAFVTNIIFFLVTRLDYYFVAKYCNDMALSNYVQVSKMGQLLILLPSMIAAVLFPYSSGGDKEEYLQKLQSVCRIITVLFIPIATLIIACGYWLFPWIFGLGFRQMYVAMMWYLPGFYALSLVTLLAAFLAGRAMLGANLAASVLALAVIITGDVLLIPVLGINAAAATSSVAYLLCLAYLLFVYQNRIGSRFANFFVIKRSDVQQLLSMVKK